jgi:hypothetical protein
MKYYLLVEDYDRGDGANYYLSRCIYIIYMYVYYILN